MRRFDFPLDRVLKVKRQLERVAEMAQQRARIAVDTAQATLAQRREELARHAERMSASVGRAMSSMQWTNIADGAEQFARTIAEAEAVVAEAEKKLAEASDARAKIAKEIEALATLRSEQWEAWSRENRIAAQTELDEVGLRRWMANRDDATPARTES